MGAIDLETIVQKARRRAICELFRADIRISLCLAEDGSWVATSPDLDWLYCVAADQNGVQLRAVAAIVKVSTWVGVNPRLRRGRR